MSNIKRFEDFVKESTENKGKGIDGDTDLLPKPPQKQTINKPDLNPMDNLGIRGRQITTDKIDGIIRGVKDGVVYVEDRLTKEYKEYPIAEFLKEFHKSYKKEKKEEKVEENKKDIWDDVEKFSDQDKELLNKIIQGDVNESKREKEMWEKKWESFAVNYIKATKDVVDEDIIEEEYDKLTPEEFNELPTRQYNNNGKVDKELTQKAVNDYNFKKSVKDVKAIFHDNFGKSTEMTYDDLVKVLMDTKIGEQVWTREELEELSYDELNELREKYLDILGKPQKPEMKIERFVDFSNRLKIKSENVNEDLEDVDEIDENLVPKPLPQIECSDCSVKVDDNEESKERHLYSKHNFKPTVDDLDTWLLEYFPPNVEEKK